MSKPITWGDCFDEIEADSIPNEDRAGLAAAHFADLLEVVNHMRGVYGLHALTREDMRDAA